MRRLLRPIVIAVASLGLALGAGVGLAAPAFADTGFTAAISNAPILNTSSEIDFAGTKPGTSTISAEIVDIGGSMGSCGGTAAGSSNWVCEFDPSDGFEVGRYSAQFVVTAADNTVSTQVLAFVIYASTDVLPSEPTTPIVGYQFTPSGVTVTTTATNPGSNAVSTVITPLQDGPLPSTSCPDGVDYYDPLGSSATTPLVCSPTDPIDSETAVVAQSKQGTIGDGTYVSPDQSNGVAYVPSNDSTGIAYTVNQAALAVTVTGSVPYYYATAPFGIVILDDSGAIVCRTSAFTPDSDSRFDDWSCTTGALSYGTHNLVASVEDDGYLADGGEDSYLDDVGASYGYYVQGGLSLALPVGSVTFTAPITPITGGGSSGPTTPNWSFTIGGDLTNVHPGDTLDISGSGLPAGTSLDTILHSVPTDLGTVVAAADGTFDQTVTVPADTALGDHTIQVTASGPGIFTTTKQQAITVTAVPATTGSSGSGKSDVTTTKPTATHGAGVGDPGAGIAPNILTRALTPIADVAVHPNKIISAFEIGLVLLLLAVLPAHLLNATIAEQSDRFERRFPKVRSPRWLTALAGWFRSAPVVGGIVVTLSGANANRWEFTGTNTGP